MESKITTLYEEFWKTHKINTETGIWENAPVGRNLRFATMPYIGRNYKTAKKKVLFVGADIGRDEAKLGYNRDMIINLDMRRDGFEIDPSNRGRNMHVPGTFIAAIVAMKEIYPKAYALLEENKTYENRSAIRNLSDQLPLDIMKEIALTNFYKFVEVGREKRQGNQDRKYFGIKPSITKLFRDEIIALSPDVIWFQGSVNDLNYNMVKEAESILEKEIKIIKTHHPSAYGKGANMVKYYTGLNL